MQELTNLIMGIIVLALGIPLGHYLAKFTKEELKAGQRWFKLIVVVSLASGVVGLVIGNDVLMFGSFFVAIVTSRSLIK